MKKSMIFVGMLAIGYANAQEGVVGINTENPKATLDITPEANNLTGTTNEGIIAPRLSKTRIANIEASKLTEGTLVYATDETSSPISAYTGADAKVAKITEKGYYFYNGTEWVKAGADATSQIWQKQADKSILLVDNDNKGEIKYTVDGGYINIPKEKRKISYWDDATFTISDIDLDLNLYNTSRLNIGFSDKIPTPNTAGRYPTKYLVENILYVDNNEGGRINRINASNTKAATTKEVSRNLGALYAAVTRSEHFGTGKVGTIIGTYSTGDLSNGSSDRVVGAYNQVSSGVSSNIPTMEATFNYLTPRGSGAITDAFGSRNFARIETSSNTIENLILSSNVYDIRDTFTGTISNVVGVNIRGAVALGVDKNAIKNMYGLKIEGITKGAEANYAIYTDEGKVKLGDLAQTGAGDRVVYADENGVLKTGGSIASNNGVQNETGMTCTAANAGKINYTTIQKDGKDVGVFGFCMQKGTDYVWAYMLGGSNIYGTSANGAAFGQGL